MGFKLKDDQLGYIEPIILILKIMMFLMTVVCVIIFFGLAVVFFFREDGLSGQTKLIVGTAAIPFVLVIINIVLKIVKSVEDKKPFIIENVKRLQFLGFMFIVFNLITILISGVLFFLEMPNENEISEIIPAGNFDFSWFFTGAIILVISEVFRIGIKLRQENELTV